jgi:hypothetical protein
LQGSDLGGVPIVPPEALAEDIHNVFVGLNPAHAKKIVTSVVAFESRDLAYFYI